MGAEELMPSSYSLSTVAALVAIFVLMAGLLFFVAHGLAGMVVGLQVQDGLLQLPQPSVHLQQ